MSSQFIKIKLSFCPRFSAADSQSIVNVFEIFYVGQIVRTSLICEVKQVSSCDKHFLAGTAAFLVKINFDRNNKNGFSGNFGVRS